MKKKIRSTEEINAEIKSLLAKSQLLQAIVTDRERKEKLPKVKERFEGNYFKQLCEDYTAYKHCTKVLSAHFGLFNTVYFEDKVWSIRNGDKLFFDSQSGKQITRREYLAALKKFKSQLDKLGK